MNARLESLDRMRDNLQAYLRENNVMQKDFIALTDWGDNPPSRALISSILSGKRNFSNIWMVMCVARKLGMTVEQFATEKFTAKDSKPDEDV